MKSIVLSGFMATGKSTVGPLVARRLGLPFVDTDRLIEQEAGCSVAELWARDGEPAFRVRESAVVEACLRAKPQVIAVGGGALLERGLRHRVLDEAIVVTLTASRATIERRVGDLALRPLLAGGEERIGRLLEERAAAYAECHAALATDDVEPEELAATLGALASADPLVLPLGERTVRIDVVDNHPEALTDAVARVAPSRVIVVTDANVRRLRGAFLDRALAALAVPHAEMALAAGESQKTLGSVQAIWECALGEGVDRDALVLGFGGGVVTDLAGFAAATLLRGVDALLAPTTLLGMVDAAVGGKTGFDLPAGKNLVGALHQPRAVVVDMAHLATLPPRELRAGVAEMIKTAVMTDGAAFEALAAAAPTGSVSVSNIRAAIRAKAAVVRDDEREAGARILLNLGHTVGHALEAATGYQKYLHGEAVAIGLCVELAAFVTAGWTPAPLADRVREALAAWHLPTTMTREESHALQHFSASDKKRHGGHVRVAVPIAWEEAVLREVPWTFFCAG